MGAPSASPSTHPWASRQCPTAPALGGPQGPHPLQQRPWRGPRTQHCSLTRHPCGCLDFLLSTDTRLLWCLFVFMVVPMLNPDGWWWGIPNCGTCGLWLRGEGCCGEGMVLVVLYCDFHWHSWKNNIFMYGCDGGSAGAGLWLHQRIFPLMFSKNTPDKFSFPSCKFKVQKSKAGTGWVVMWCLGVSNSYTLEVAFGGSTLAAPTAPCPTHSWFSSSRSVLSA
uniref:Uncharacterized protein n=1 Tax=Melopsittacus undulatus TaxID=13146 RepID=A0A8V5G4A4_MELUD